MVQPDLNVALDLARSVSVITVRKITHKYCHACAFNFRHQVPKKEDSCSKCLDRAGHRVAKYAYLSRTIIPLLREGQCHQSHHNILFQI